MILLGALCAGGTLKTVQAQQPDRTSPKGSTFLISLKPKLSFISRQEDKTLSRHYTPFSGPPGPTLPYGATINSNRYAAEASTIRYTAASSPLIYDFPPGAKLRLVAATKP